MSDDDDRIVAVGDIATKTMRIIRKRDAYNPLKDPVTEKEWRDRVERERAERNVAEPPRFPCIKCGKETKEHKIPGTRICCMSNCRYLAYTDQSVAQFVGQLAHVSDEMRLDIFKEMQSRWCIHCGRQQDEEEYSRPCQCWNDE